MPAMNESKVERAKKEQAGGLEPDWSLPITEVKDVRLARYYKWCNDNFDMEDGHRFILSYMKSAGYTDEDVSKAASVPNWSFQGASWMIARLIDNRMIDVPSYQQKFLSDKISQVISKVEDAPKTANTVFKPSIQESIRRKAWEAIIADVEVEVDKFTRGGFKSNYSLKKDLEERKIDKTYLPHIDRHYTKLFGEAWDAYYELDEQAVEGYSLFGKKNIEKLLLFYKRLIDDVKEVNSVKVNRGPRVLRKIKKKKVKKNGNRIKRTHKGN